MFRLGTPPPYQQDRGIKYTFKIGCGQGARNGATALLKQDIPTIMPWVMNGFELEGKILPHPHHWVAVDPNPDQLPTNEVAPSAFADDNDLFAAAVAHHGFVPPSGEKADATSSSSV